ncbi:hypothetical protein GR157_15540 [Burkholderia sp. 4701]|nr:hypothetical protein [Burkholderia sp. 4701]MXN82869.1 hypothetical protein [Burkholderia sp. 4812]
MTELQLESVLTCPHCGFARQETMPLDACRFFYECQGCKALLTPKPGDCCVFCSYGSVCCPSRQRSQSGPPAGGASG